MTVRRLLLPSGFVALGLAATAMVFNASSAPTGPKAAPLITDDAIRRHVTYLASDQLKGRLPGTPGAEMAARYIADQFKRAGLAPAGTKGYFQEFPFVAKVTPGPKNSLKLLYGGQTQAATVRTDFMPAAFSAPLPVESEVVFAGFGISAQADAGYDDYAGIDVTDKIVLVLPFSPAGSNPHTKFGNYLSLRYKAVTARAKGAKGLIVVAEDDDFKSSQLARLRYDDAFADSGIPTAIVSRNFANQMFVALRQDIAGLEKRIAEEQKPASFVLPQLRVALQTDIVRERQMGKNVVGFLEGTDPRLKQEILVIGAHYDHLGLGGPNSLAPKEGDIHNGADDNASGTAGVMELSKAIASLSPRPRRSVLFVAFSAEEKGLLGSEFFANNATRPLDKVVAMFNMDMIGRLRDEKLMVQGVGTATEWKPLLERLNGEAKFTLTLGEDGFGPSDHSSFYKKNIPVLFFFTGNHPDYHKPSDDADKINYEGEHRILDFVYRAAIETANGDAKPTYQKAKGDGPARSSNSGFRVSLGTIPDYAAEVTGLKLSGVREGGPAEKAGLRGGDIIVKLNGRDIKNVYDYTYVLQELKPEQEIEVVVLRGTETLTMKLVTAKPTR